METSKNKFQNRKIYVSPQVEVYGIEPYSPIATSLGDGHEPTEPGYDDLEAKKFGFDETWDGVMWEE